MKESLIYLLKVSIFWVIFGALITFTIEFMWNILVPSLFHGPAMNYQQAGAAYVLILAVAGIFKAMSVDLS